MYSEDHADLKEVVDGLIKDAYNFLAIHVSYIIVFYAALFSMIGVSFEKNRKMGSAVIVTFVILIGCLIYYLLPF